MMEILKSKAIIILFVVMLGFVYLKSTPMDNSVELNSNDKNLTKEITYKNN